MDREKIEAGVRLILEGVGEDPDREGLLKTPERVAKMYEEVFRRPDAGSVRALRDDVRRAPRGNGAGARHPLLFYVRAPSGAVLRHGARGVHPAADGRICGLSKLARLVDVFAKRPQVQERLTSQIADTLIEQLHPQGVIVVLEAEHLCMSMRGVKKAGARTTTSAVRGAFERSQATRAEAAVAHFRP